MNTREFFELLLADSGWIFTATIPASGNGFINTAHKDIDSAVANINRLTFEGKAAYFALATYAEEKVWDASFVNREGEKVGKFRYRTQANAVSLKSFFLDLDVAPGDPAKFESKEQALSLFESFRVILRLPDPMIVDSGGGYHIYWPLAQAVSTVQWRDTADKLKAICLHLMFKADRSLTSDQARVLRAIGGFNHRRSHVVELVQVGTVTTYGAFTSLLDNFIDANNVPLVAQKSSVPANALAGAPPAVDFGDNNLGPSADPINFDRVTFNCAQMGEQVATRGRDTGEKLWRAALGIAKFAEPQDLAYRAISDNHPAYDEQRTLTKIENWRTGPTTCAHFHVENPLACEGCTHWGKLTSPAQLGHIIREAPSPQMEVVDLTTGITETIKLPDPPEKYKRRADGAVLVANEVEEGELDYIVICPYDFYPTRILRQAGGDSTIDEKSMWRAHLPRLGIQDIEVSQSLVADGRKLHGVLLAKGLYVNPDQAKALQLYMSAYLQKLAADADREKLYDRMGWHNEHKEFVLGNRVITADGKMHSHEPSRSVRAVTKEGVHPQGTLSGWKEAMNFYLGDGYEGHRFFIYASFGAPLFHMNDTGNKGVLMTASGASGRGKTTCLKACSSVWGEPDALILNGNKDGSTINALYESLGTFHSLPFLWDDITERDPEEIRRVLLNISQGAGKVRMKDGAGLNDRRIEWETIVQASANTDDVSRIMSSGKDVDPHLMRLVGVEFSIIDAGPEAKIRADNFIRQIKGNYGHAGPVYMQQVVANYDVVRRVYINNISKVDRLLNSSNAAAERFWSATVAAAYTGAKMAQAMNLLPAFDIEADLLWMVNHLGKQRTTISESKQSPTELFAEFLENHIGNTLVLSAKGSSNLDNVVVRPHTSLLIRHEIDTNLMFVARAAIMDYCTEAKTSFRTLETALEKEGVIVQRNTQKVLGAETAYAKGQTRVWKIDSLKLGPLPAAIAGALPSNVTPIGVKAA